LQCTDRKGKVLSKLNNIGITSLISEGVNVCLYSFAGESSQVVKLVVNEMKVSLRSKKRNRIEPTLLVKSSDTTHISCVMSYWCKSIPIQVSTVMEVAKKVSE
jgi:hypothetical protein